MILDWEALKAIIKHYVLYDHQCRRAFLVLVGQFGLAVLVLAILLISGKLPALFLFVVSTGASLGTSLGMPLVVAGVIQREKAEGSFRALRALPLRVETFFLGAVLAGVIASILAFLPPYVIATIGLILRGGDVALLQIYTGWAALLISLFSASASLTVALCVNSPAVIANLLGGSSALISILISIQVLFDIIRFSEEELHRFFRFILSLEGQVLVSASVIILSTLILYTGSRIFSRKKAYV